MRSRMLVAAVIAFAIVGTACTRQENLPPSGQNPIALTSHSDDPERLTWPLSLPAFTSSGPLLRSPTQVRRVPHATAKRAANAPPATMMAAEGWSPSPPASRSASHKPRGTG